MPALIYKPEREQREAARYIGNLKVKPGVNEITEEQRVELEKFSNSLEHLKALFTDRVLYFAAEAEQPEETKEEKPKTRKAVSKTVED